MYYINNNSYSKDLTFLSKVGDIKRKSGETIFIPGEFSDVAFNDALKYRPIIYAHNKEKHLVCLFGHDMYNIIAEEEFNKLTELNNIGKISVTDKLKDDDTLIQSNNIFSWSDLYSGATRYQRTIAVACEYLSLFDEGFLRYTSGKLIKIRVNNTDSDFMETFFSKNIDRRATITVSGTHVYANIDNKAYITSIKNLDTHELDHMDYGVLVDFNYFTFGKRYTQITYNYGDYSTFCEYVSNKSVSPFVHYYRSSIELSLFLGNYETKEAAEYIIKNYSELVEKYSKLMPKQYTRYTNTLEKIKDSKDNTNIFMFYLDYKASSFGFSNVINSSLDRLRFDDDSIILDIMKKIGNGLGSNDYIDVPNDYGYTCFKCNPKVLLPYKDELEFMVEEYKYKGNDHEISSYITIKHGRKKVQMLFHVEDQLVETLRCFKECGVITEEVFNREYCRHLLSR